MSRGKRALFISAAISLSTLLVLVGLLGLDLYLHQRFEQVAGLNTRGYRGPVAKKKQPSEQRIVVLGGSTALGYGVLVEESFPAYLEQKLNDRRRRDHRGPVSVVNLAYNNEGAYAFLYNLRYYENLDYDVALFYTGVNDLGGPNTTVLRRDSPIFRLTGYYPIFPVIFTEKAMALRHGGDLEGAYRGRKTVFHPNLAQRSTASLLEATVRINHALARQLERFATEPAPPPIPTEDLGCGSWAHYCASMYRAVEYVLGRGKVAVVVSEPYLSDGHAEQQHIMAGMLREQFGDRPGLRYLDLGKAVDHADPARCYDGMHLTAKGNEQIAAALVQPVLNILE